MRMLKSNDRGNDQFKTPTGHALCGRKLCQLMPRPSTNCSISAVMGGYHGVVKREMMEKVPLVTARWNPTPEQLHALEDMYRRGITTPSAEQIQQIAAKLRRFGKIEGKNVFYWFQNHKARERQKKRRHLESLAGKQTQQVSALGTDKHTGLSRKPHLEFERQSKLPTPSNRSTLSEDSESMRGAVIAERKEDEWAQLSQNVVTATMEACWKLDLSPCLSPNNSVSNITAQKISGQETAEPFAAVNRNVLLLSPKKDNIYLDSGVKENHTLQLFPIGSSDLRTEEEVPQLPCMGIRFRPNEFIEFLPTKN